jgi:hypothetical protein
VSEQRQSHEATSATFYSHDRGATTIRLLRMGNDRHKSQELIHTIALKYGTKK